MRVLPLAAAVLVSSAAGCLEGLPPDLVERRVVARARATDGETEAPAPPAAAPREPVLVPQTGHVAQVWSVAFHPSGRFVATGGFDHTIGIWNTTGGLVAHLVGHHEALKRVAWSADGKVFASIARDSRIIVWDLARFAPKLTIEHPGFDLELSGDGKRIYTVGPKAELSVYDAATGRLIDTAQTPNGEGRQLLGVALSPDGRSVATASLDGRVHIWDARTLRVRATGMARTWRVAFSPDGSLVAAPTGAHVLMFDAQTGKTTRDIPLTSPVSQLVFSPDGARLIAGGSKRVHVLDVASGRQLASYSVGILEALAISPDGSLLVTGNDDPQVRLWRADTGAPLRAFGTPWGEVRAASFDPKGERFASAAAGWIDVWDARVGRILQRLAGEGREPGAPVWSATGKLIAAGVGDGSVRVWDAASGAKVTTISRPTRDDWGPRLQFSPDGERLAVVIGASVSIWDHGRQKVVKTFTTTARMIAGVLWKGSLLVVGGADAVELFDTQSWKLVATLDLKQVQPFSRADGLLFSPDARQLLVTSGQYLSLWDAGTGALLAKTSGRTLFALPAFYPDGKHIVFPGMNRGASVWDPTTGRVTPLVSIGAAVRQLRVSPDGAQVAVASDDSSIRLVDTQHHTLLRTLSGPQARIWSLEFNPSGTLLLSASHQARIHRVSDGKAVTFRARPDRPSGWVHTSDGFFAGSSAALDSVRFRIGADLEHAELVAPSALPQSNERPELIAELLR